MNTPVTYRFSFGPWNISEGGDPFGGDVRKVFPHEEKFALYRPLGFEGVQFHDDDVVPGMDDLKPDQIQKKATEVKAMLANQGLTPEFVAPRLWFADQTVDGAYTSNSASDRAYAWDRTKKCIDIANAVGSKAIVLWLAREGTYIREAKDAKLAYQRLLETVNAMLDGLDASDEMAFALAHDKLASVHLNDQNGLKYDQDKNFGGANLRAAFNQVRVLEESGYGRRGEFIGLDVKAIRTQRGCPVTDHLKNSRELFLALVQKVRTVDQKLVQQYRDARDYEALELYILKHIMGLK
jgi:xylose isomerase